MHVCKEDEFPPWENLQYQIGVYRSEVKQKWQTWRGDQRLSTAASFNEDCRGEKQGLISGCGHCTQFITKQGNLRIRYASAGGGGL